MLIIILKEFSFLPKSSSTSNGNSAEEAVQLEMPRRKGWQPAPPATPSSNTAASPYASTSSTPHAIAEHDIPPVSLTPVPSITTSSTHRAVTKSKSTNLSTTPGPSTAVSSAARAVAKCKNVPQSRVSGPSSATLSSVSASILDLDDEASSRSSLTEPNDDREDHSFEIFECSDTEREESFLPLVDNDNCSIGTRSRRSTRGKAV
ncbi:hypothetical protein BDD12DRAFT_801514 [Trichophaea hybrida]|nr:hypothetical protein BDD12DRAFT_801514 [Trichophaea hybrida]